MRTLTTPQLSAVLRALADHLMVEADQVHKVAAPSVDRLMLAVDHRLATQPDEGPGSVSRSQVAAVLENYADALLRQRTEPNGAGSTPAFDRWLRTTAHALRAAEPAGLLRTTAGA